MAHRTGDEIRREVLEVEKELKDETDATATYMIAEDEILAIATDQEIVNYNMYMAKITGLV